MKAPVLIGTVAVVAIAGFFAGRMTRGEDTDTPVVEKVPLAMIGSAENGKKLFVSEGCVICHSVNGVGGKAAPGLDAAEWRQDAGAYDFAARMWLGASIMADLQRLELGYQINISGQDLADLTAFSRDENVQAGFSIEEVPEDLRDWFLNEIDMEEDLADKYIGEEVYEFPQDQ